MDEEIIKSQLEILADDSGIQMTTRQIKKYINLAMELKDEVGISLDEITEELNSISPDDDDDWNEFVEHFAIYLFEIIEENADEDSEFYEAEE